jgi:isocitrate dehydrogenase
MSPSKVDSKPLYRIASIPADGIGPEVISAGITVLEKLASTLGTFDLSFQHFDWDSRRYKTQGRYLPEDALTTLKKFDAILFGAVGAPGMCTYVFLLFFFFKLSSHPLYFLGGVHAARAYHKLFLFPLLSSGMLIR